MPNSPRERASAASSSATTDRQPIYVHVTVGKRSEPSGPSGKELRADGRELACQCLKQIDAIENGRERFPPRLFTLWATPAFAGTDNFQSLLAGIHDVLEENCISQKDAPLIGTSAAAVWFDAKVSENGAVLICQASKWIKAKVAVAENAQDEPEQAAKQLLDALRDGKEVDINPRGNRYLMTYLPGFSGDMVANEYVAPKIVDELNRLTFGRLNLFGGASAAGIADDNFQPRVGSQFVNDRVYQRAAAAALVTSEIAYGMGINQGVAPTNESVVVKEVSPDGLSVVSFYGRKAKVAFERWDTGKPFVFVVRGTDGQRTVLVPRLVEGEIRLSRPVQSNTVLEIARPSSDVLQQSVLELEMWVRRWFRIKCRQVAAVLAIGCVSCYRERNRIDFDVDRALAKAAKQFSNGVHVGCYLNGEIGIDRLSRSTLANWSLSETLIADNIPPRSEMFLGFDALAKYFTAAATAVSVHDAIQRALQIIERAAFSGGMISLVYRDEPTNWIRGQGAFGGGWPTVMPLTAREFDGEDILAVVARQRELIFVRDAQSDPRCDNDAAKKGGVISFAAVRLMDEKCETPVGILQIDLADLRYQRLNQETWRLLETLGRIVELLLNRAIQAEELAVARQLDQLAEDSLREPSVAAAVQHLFAGACKVLMTTGHVRLLSEDGQTLQLVAGVGQYYELVRTCRVDLPADDAYSATTRTFRDKEDRVVNNTEIHELAQPLLKRFLENDPLGIAIRKTKAFTNYLIRLGQDGHILGVIDFASAEAWFFTEARLRSMDHIRQRMAHMIVHFRDRDRRAKAQEALVGMDTYLANRLHALKNRVKSLSASLELLQTREKNSLSPEGKQRLEKAILATQPLFDTFDEAQRLGTLLSESNTPTSVNVHSLVVRMVNECRERQQRESTPPVQFDVGLANPRMANAMINVDEDQVAESLRNLLNNGALTAAAASEGWVRVTLDEDSQPDRCVILVQDSGQPGLSQETFDAFVDGQVKSTDGGLGLYLSRLFCEANGGSLDLAISGPQPILKISFPWRKS